jgi:regulator of protease activity HflC (stomatin/prohibitin superfamily)
VDLLIEDLSVAAKEAIERAAGEAAKAAALASVEREAAAMREAARWRLEAETARRAGMKNTIIAALIGTLGGLALGVVINR